MSAITDSAQGRECLMKLPGVCRGGTDTTVWAHSNQAVHGKGMGLKAYDQFGCYACYACHMVYDRQWSRPAGLTQLLVDWHFVRGMTRSQAILVQLGLWDGKSNAPRSQARPAKSKKIPVLGLSHLQRMAQGGGR